MNAIPIRSCLVPIAWAIAAIASTAATERADAAAPANTEIVSGSASGFAKLDGKQYEIRHSYALAVGESYWLLLTDVSVPGESFRSPIALRALGFDGKTHGLLLTVDAQGTPNPIMILQVAEATGDLSWQKLEFAKRSKSELEGKTYTISPQKSANKTYEYNISFKAPVNEIARH